MEKALGMIYNITLPLPPLRASRHFGNLEEHLEDESMKVRMSSYDCGHQEFLILTAVHTQPPAIH